MREAVFRQYAGALGVAMVWLATTAAANPALDAALIERIDRLVSDEVAASPLNH